MCELCRRNFLVGVAALGAAAASPSRVFAQADAIRRPPADIGTMGLPQRGEVVLRNAYVMTMDAALGDIAGGTVHVRDGEIVAVGRDVDAPGARVIAGEDMIVLPGLIETHWHMWNTLFRSFSGDEQAHGYFPMVARYGANMTPDDMYQGTRLAAAEAINSGTTTVHDWCHNIRSREYAERDLAALNHAGIRARFSYGWAQGQDDKEALNISDIEALHREWTKYSNEGLITLGLGWRGIFRAGPLPENVYRTEYEAARAMGIPITVHIASARPPIRSRRTPRRSFWARMFSSCTRCGQARTRFRDQGSGRHHQHRHAFRYAHRVWAAAGQRFSCGRNPVRRVGRYLSADRQFQRVQRAARGARCGECAHAERIQAHCAPCAGARYHRGARSMGIDNKVGSLKPGKRADIIMVNTGAINMGGFVDPAHLLVGSALPENVDTVMVDGRILKQGGKLTNVSAAQVAAGARAALEAVRKRTAWR